MASNKEGNGVKNDARIEEADVKKEEHDVKTDVTNKSIDVNMTPAQITEIEEYKAQVQTLNAEITRLKTVIMDGPDPVDLVRLQERNDGLNLMIEEKIGA